MKHISIIMPCFNADKHIKTAILSVLNQTYENWSLIIVDDASTDNTWDIIKKYEDDDPRIFCYQLNNNEGAAMARNYGLDHSKGEFVAFLDSDDMWKPTKLAFQLEYMLKNNLTASHTSCEVYRDEELLKQTNSPKILYYVDLLRYNRIVTSTVMLDYNIVKDLRMPNIRNRQDWAFWLLISQDNPFFYIYEPLTIYLDRKESISSNKLKMVWYHWLVYYKIENKNLPKSVLLLIKNIYLHIKKDLNQNEF